MNADVDAVLRFLGSRTPAAWLAQAPEHLHELLVDHANCEKKAAGTALSLLYRYTDHPELLRPLSRLAREELKHFEQVVAELARLGLAYPPLSPSRYAAGLRRLVRSHEPVRLVDTLLCAAVVEARSCERFLGLVDVLEAPLAGFYERLLASEARHFELYLGFAERLYEDARPGPGESLAERLALFLAEDRRLIALPDSAFRFHSGPLAAPQCRGRASEADRLPAAGVTGESSADLSRS